MSSSRHPDNFDDHVHLGTVEAFFHHPDQSLGDGSSDSGSEPDEPPQAALPEPLALPPQHMPSLRMPGAHTPHDTPHPDVPPIPSSRDSGEETTDVCEPFASISDPSSKNNSNRKRPRPEGNRPGNDLHAAPKDRDENTCPICFEPWANAGDHHIVCAPCGHLFGYICIKKWLQSQRRPCCPICKQPVRVRDLIFLFGVPISFKVVDNAECKRLRQNLEDEKKSHEETKKKLISVNRLIEGLQREVEKADRGVLGVAGSSSEHKNHVTCVARWRTNGGSAAAVFDGKGGLLFGENLDFRPGMLRQRVSRLDVGRSVVAESSRAWVHGRIDRMALCEVGGGMQGCLAIGAGEKVRILRKELILVHDIKVDGGVACSVMWWEGDKIVVGTERGNIGMMDLRMADGGWIWRKRVGECAANGSWRVHSLATVGPGVLAGTTGGIYWVGAEGGEVTKLTSTESKNWICGVAADSGLVAVASRTKGDTDQKGRVALHEGITGSGESLRLGKAKMTLEGHRQRLPFCLPGVVSSEGQLGQESFVCIGDWQREAGIRVWGEDGGTGVFAPWTGQWRSAVGMRLPRNARMGSVAAGTQALFGCVSDEVVRVYGVGRY
eukprot:GFKZ01010736.1.p1 GENE.GFKZ01010736.1~~GFKZ01010736.1.p1  ORF type:complete len:608 (-),score=46.47 GFKZ01010736.1:398-2221(-)